MRHPPRPARMPDFSLIETLAADSPGNLLLGFRRLANTLTNPASGGQRHACQGGLIRLRNDTSYLCSRIAGHDGAPTVVTWRRTS